MKALSCPPQLQGYQSIALVLTRFNLVLTRSNFVVTPPLPRSQEGVYCEGVTDLESYIKAPCSYPGYHCSCINQPHEYPSCQCSRALPTTRPDLNTSPPAPPADTIQETTWRPVLVLGVGSGVLVVVLLTSIACCCVCRQWYSNRARLRRDKPPEYCDSPPPPYVHSTFYSRDQRPRTVHRMRRAERSTVLAGPSFREVGTSSPRDIVTSSPPVSAVFPTRLLSAQSDHVIDLSLINTQNPRLVSSAGMVHQHYRPRPGFSRGTHDDLTIVDLEEDL